MWPSRRSSTLKTYQPAGVRTGSVTLPTSASSGSAAWNWLERSSSRKVPSTPPRRGRGRVGADLGGHQRRRPRRPAPARAPRRCRPWPRSTSAWVTSIGRKTWLMARRPSSCDRRRRAAGARRGVETTGSLTCAGRQGEDRPVQGLRRTGRPGPTTPTTPPRLALGPSGELAAPRRRTAGPPARAACTLATVSCTRCRARQRPAAPGSGCRRSSGCPARRASRRDGPGSSRATSFSSTSMSGRMNLPTTRRRYCWSRSWAAMRSR